MTGLGMLWNASGRPRWVESRQESNVSFNAAPVHRGQSQIEPFQS